MVGHIVYVISGDRCRLGYIMVSKQTVPFPQVAQTTTITHVSGRMAFDSNRNGVSHYFIPSSNRQQTMGVVHTDNNLQFTKWDAGEKENVTIYFWADTKEDQLSSHSRSELGS